MITEERTSMRIGLLFVALATIPLWWALSRTTTYDAITYLPLSGYEASSYAWLGLALACAASIALAWSHRIWAPLVATGSVIASIVLVRLMIMSNTPAKIIVEDHQCAIGSFGQQGPTLLCELFADRSAERRASSIEDLRRPLDISTGLSLVLVLIAGSSVRSRRR